MSGIMFDRDLFDDAFSESQFGSIFVLGNIFYSGSIFDLGELFDKHNGFSDDHEYQEVKSIPHVPTITESRNCFSHNQIVRNLIRSSSTIVETVEDTTMDFVKRSHTFKEQYILVDEEKLGHIL